MTTSAYVLFIPFLWMRAILPTIQADRVPSTAYLRQETGISEDTTAAQLIRQFLTAVQRGDHTVPKAVLHPQVTWYQPGNNRFSGVKQSSKAVFQLVRDMSEASSGTLRLAHVKAIAVHGNEVACLINWQAVMPGGGVLDVDNIDVYTLEAGKIVRVTVYSADQAQEDWFWGH